MVGYFDAQTADQSRLRHDFQITHMKTLFLSLAGLVLTVQGFGQTAPKGVAVPAPVQEAFAKAYPNAENPR